MEKAHGGGKQRHIEEHAPEGLPASGEPPPGKERGTSAKHAGEHEKDPWAVV
jgi:hypothetical protein